MFGTFSSAVGNRQLSDSPCFDLCTDGVVHNGADAVPDVAHVGRHRDNRGHDQAGDEIDRAEIRIGDRPQRQERIDHIVKLRRGEGRAGQEVEHLGRHDQKDIYQHQNQKHAKRMHVVHHAHAAIAPCPARTEINQRIAGQGDGISGGSPIAQHVDAGQLREQDRRKKAHRRQ